MFSGSFDNYWLWSLIIRDDLLPDMLVTGKRFFEKQGAFDSHEYRLLLVFTLVSSLLAIDEPLDVIAMLKLITMQASNGPSITSSNGRLPTWALTYIYNIVKEEAILLHSDTSRYLIFLDIEVGNHVGKGAIDPPSHLVICSTFSLVTSY